MPEITMPRLSDTMEDGVISAWLKQVGEKVTRGEVLAEIETDKALMELEAYDDGVLEQIIAEAGARVPIGEPIAIVGDGSGAAAAPAAQPAAPAAQTSAPASHPAAETAAAAQPTPPAAQPGNPVTTNGDAVPGGAAGAPAGSSGGANAGATPAGTAGAPAASTPGDGGRTKSSPLARKVARELGVDIATVAGTGPGGRVRKQDVESAYSTGGSGASAADHATLPGTVSADAGSGVAGGASGVNGAGVAPTPTAPTAGTAYPAPASGTYDEIPLTTIQRVSATRLTESKQQAPHIYLTSAIDVTELFAFRAQVNKTLAETGGKVSVNDLLVKAVAVTLRANPTVNVSFAGDKLFQHHGIHLGIAVATPAGLLVPVVRDADRKSVSEIAAESRDKAERARDRKLRADEMGGGTFTISNLGMFGIEHFTAVINPPEAAILAVGGATDELRLEDGQVVSRKILRVTMSADHRAIDGAVAAQFLAQLEDLIEHPLRIVT
ncbi:dihydrolipoamide acetyltransferase family protein [Nocardia sp. NPDC088792]|uniref:dihydrolipoamide acetyltransferase family protein n=1 Tax=Nocardia sp. NPDC088792 TaxID=3364332 RepID=UPI003829AC8E